MKILILAPYMYDGVHKEFCRNKTGFGLLIPEIAMSVGAKEDVVLSTYMPTKGFTLSSDYGSCQVLKHSCFDFFRGITAKGIKLGMREVLTSGLTRNNRIHELYYSINYGSIKRIIKKTNPDIVHVQDVSIPLIEACKDINVPYLVTLHGLNALRDDVDPYLAEKERKFVIQAYLEHIPVTVISTGIKKRIESKYLNGERADNTFVVTNGTNVDRGKITSEKERKKIVTVIGSLCERKNQRQIIEAVKLMKSDFETYEFHLCGMDVLDGELQKLTHEYELDNIICFRGFLTPVEIDDLLECSILNIVASKDEGFGISIIEAFNHGVPTVTFADLDVVEDVYSDKTMLLCNSRKTEEFAKRIKDALNREWDREYIRQYSNQFSLQSMAEKYIDVYHKVIEGHQN